MSSGAKDSIPNNVRKMVQNIKEIADSHSDEEIYAMLKDCSMDPNETADKLLLGDKFHEVKRKRDRRKEIKKKEYKAIREHGRPHYHVLTEMIGGTSASGGMQMPSTHLPPTYDEERDVEDEFLNTSSHPLTEDPIQPNEDGVDLSTRPQRSGDALESQKKENSKSSRLEGVESCMDKWATTVDKISGESLARQKYLELRAAKLERESAVSSFEVAESRDPYSAAACMDILNTMIDLPDELFVKATEAFGKQHFREAFVKMPKSRRMVWLERVDNK